jgi:hypothetical protein
VLEMELAVNRFLVGYCRVLVADLPDERLAEQPAPGVNHPAWILGHLAVTAQKIRTVVAGGDIELPESWGALFMGGSTPTSTRSDYPSKEELLKAVESSFDGLRSAAAASAPEQLDRPSPHPRTKNQLPTVGHLAAFLLTGHLGVHLGQLTMWRRLTGLPPLF